MDEVISNADGSTSGFKFAPNTTGQDVLEANIPSHYRCPKHGDQNTECMHVVSKKNDIDINFCFECLVEMLKKHCEVLEEIEK